MCRVKREEVDTESRAGAFLARADEVTFAFWKMCNPLARASVKTLKSFEVMAHVIAGRNRSTHDATLPPPSKPTKPSEPGPKPVLNEAGTHFVPMRSMTAAEQRRRRKQHIRTKTKREVKKCPVPPTIPVAPAQPPPNPVLTDGKKPPPLHWVSIVFHVEVHVWPFGLYVMSTKSIRQF
jgi:hypothetical protein